MAYRFTSTKRLAERNYPYRVDRTVPPQGFGQRFDDMIAWCDDRCGVTRWAKHGDRQGEAMACATTSMTARRRKALPRCSVVR